MTTFLLATGSVDASAVLCDYLADRLDADDVVHAVNSQVGGDGTDAEAVRDGEAALNVASVRLTALADVETHQFVRGNEPHVDVFECAADVDADEILLALRRRSPTGKLLFGSVAQKVLLNADRPVVSVPLEE